VVEDQDEDGHLLAEARSQVQVLQGHADAASFKKISTPVIEIEADIEALAEEHELHEFKFEVVQIVTRCLLIGPDVSDPPVATLIHVACHDLIGVPETFEAEQPRKNNEKHTAVELR
jgi:hypothetical protein